MSIHSGKFWIALRLDVEEERLEQTAVVKVVAKVVLTGVEPLGVEQYQPVIHVSHCIQSLPLGVILRVTVTLVLQLFILRVASEPSLDMFVKRRTRRDGSVRCQVKNAGPTVVKVSVNPGSITASCILKGTVGGVLLPIQNRFANQLRNRVDEMVVQIWNRPLSGVITRDRKIGL